MSLKERPGAGAGAFSVVCVYNDEATLGTHLVASLDDQTLPSERILLDNRGGAFPSAAAALNAGAARARGRYVLFAHQDVALPKPDWLARALPLLDALPRLGVAGCAGMKAHGGTHRERARGEILTHGRPWPWNHPVTDTEAVQTLDECILITQRDFTLAHPFDEGTFDGWHLYGADLCLRASAEGRDVVVLPLPLIHDSNGNPKGLFRYQWRLAEKHRAQGPAIATTLGVIPINRARRIFRRDLLANLRHRLRALR